MPTLKVSNDFARGQLVTVMGTPGIWCVWIVDGMTCWVEPVDSSAKAYAATLYYGKLLSQAEHISRYKRPERDKT